MEENKVNDNKQMDNGADKVQSKSIDEESKSDDTIGENDDGFIFESMGIGDHKKSTEPVDETPTIERINLDDLVSYDSEHNPPAQVFGGTRLEDLAVSIKSIGLMNPITVRPVDDGKYQILSGHNRVKATRLLGHKDILAIVRNDSDDVDAKEVYYDTNLNQQSFKDWNHFQKIQAVRYIDELIKNESRQGKRNDLAVDGTSVSKRHKLETTRDKMSQRFGIATSTMSRYRSIIKLDSHITDSLAKLLDDKKINLEAAYRISQFKPSEIIILIKWLENETTQKFTGEQSDSKFKKLSTMSKETEKDLTKKKMIEVLLSTGE